MEYTVHDLARISGITPRTLRHYDAIELLKPTRYSAAGYRLYGPAEVDRLQHILFYRELGLSLSVIRDIMQNPAFDGLEALPKHRDQLLTKRRQLDGLIANVNHTIAAREGRIIMSDSEKFEGFKRHLIADHEALHGTEMRTEYRDAVVKSSYAKIQGMTSREYEEWKRLEEAVTAALRDTFKTGDPASARAQQAAALHRRWLSCIGQNIVRQPIGDWLNAT